jgi:hypothetical protein
MINIKQEVNNIINILPDDCTLEDIQVIKKNRIIYKIEKDYILIITIVHGKRNLNQLLDKIELN